MRILIADDDATGREIARVLATRAGHEVEAVADGAAALAALTAGGFDAALLDLFMPGLGGAAVAQAIAAALPPARRPRLIALTAAIAPGGEEAAVQGFDACLSKPLRPGALAGALAGTSPPTALPLRLHAALPPAATAAAHPLRVALAAGDMAGLAAHSAALKTALALEQPLIAALCARLEHALARGDAEALAELVAAIVGHAAA